VEKIKGHCTSWQHKNTKNVINRQEKHEYYFHYALECRRGQVRPWWGVVGRGGERKENR
jgi:hypothetical protein